jgi:hypothetical protein
MLKGLPAVDRPEVVKVSLRLPKGFASVLDFAAYVLGAGSGPSRVAEMALEKVLEPRQ